MKFINGDGSDAIARQYAAMCLGNLAAEPENHEELVKLGTITTMIALLKGRLHKLASSNILICEVFEGFLHLVH